MPSADSVEAPAGGGSAPKYSVPQERIVGIEHPSIVKNFDNGFKSLGGEHHLKHVFKHDVRGSSGSTPVAGVSLRPHDPLASRISSHAVKTQNILVKVTVPRRTGRKRKRGSDEPLTETLQLERHDDSITSPNLLQRLRDNSSKYTMQAVGTIEDTHRFRDLPSLQIQLEGVPMIRQLRDHVTQHAYVPIKSFQVDLKPGHDDMTVFPGPPSFLQTRRQRYQQSSRAGTMPSEKARRSRQASKNMEANGSTAVQDGLPNQEVETTSLPNGRYVSIAPAPSDISMMQQVKNDHLSKFNEASTMPSESNVATETASSSKGQFVGHNKTPSLRKEGIALDTEQVPSGPPADLPAPRFESARKTVEALSKLLEERPIISKRVAVSRLSQYSEHAVKMAFPHVGYWVNSGPWRDTIVKYGIDPRKDVKYRKYQTVTFAMKFGAKAKDTAVGAGLTSPNYVFDGRNFIPGNSWQLCDLTDPTLQLLILTDDLRSECDPKTWGWYHNGTMSKIRIIARDKMSRIMKAEAQLRDEDYMALVTLPARATDSTDFRLSSAQHGEDMNQLSKEIGNEARHGPARGA